MTALAPKAKPFGWASRIARSFLNRLAAGYDSNAVRRDMTCEEFQTFCEIVAAADGNGAPQAVAWYHVMQDDQLYYCPGCRRVSNVPVFCICFPDRTRSLSITLALKG